ncbi:AAA-like domain-containing protein [Limnospira platensis]|uniref:AAA-like domain-containing protein n=1 Tax=Limnospira platensis TaxID=118562 RepID=UPI003D6F9B0C
MYQVGGSLDRNAPSYVERQADRELYQHLKAGKFCYVLNSRQMGKSSLLAHTRYRLELEGLRCSSIDLTLVGQDQISSAQWYKGIVVELLRGFKLWPKFPFKAWWEQQENLSPVQKLGYFIDDVLLPEISDQNLVIFIDEIDSMLSLDFPSDDFWALIRFLYNNRASNPQYNRLTFAIFGVATPSDFIQDRTRTPFNIGKPIDLTGFTILEAQILAQGLNITGCDKIAVIERILFWTNGQPFLTQKTCDLINQINLGANDAPQLITPGEESQFVDEVISSKIIYKWQEQDQPEHLMTILNRIKYRVDIMPKMLGIYQKLLDKIPVEFDNSPEQSELVLSGLVFKNQGILTIKNPIYETIFDSAWAIQELSNIRPYSQALDAWVKSYKNDVSRLLTGQALIDAKVWANDRSLSDLDYQFLAASQELEERQIKTYLEAAKTQEIEKRLAQEKKLAQLQRLLLIIATVALTIYSGLGILVWRQNQQMRISEIGALASSSHGLLASHNQLDAMVDAIKAQRRLESLWTVDSQTKYQVTLALNNAIYYTNEFNRLIGHNGSVLSLDISGDGQLIATASNDKTVKIWRQDGTLINTLPHSATVHRVAFSLDGNLVVSGSLDGTVKLWNVNGELLQNIQAHDAPVWGIDFSPNGEIIASTSGDRTVKLWRLDGTLLTTLTGHTTSVWNVAFDNNSQIVASVALDGLMKFWSIDGRLLNTIEAHEAAIWDVAFCYDTNLLVSVSTDQTAKIWTTDGTLVRTLEEKDAILGVDCSANGEFIATSGRNNTVTIWQTDGTFMKTLKRHNAIIRDVALTANGLMAASASDDGTVKLWRRNAYLLKPLYNHDDTLWNIATSADNQLIAYGSADTTYLRKTDGQLLSIIRNSGKTSRAVAFTPDADILALSANHEVQLWQITNITKSPPELLTILTGHKALIYTIAISPDGQMVAAAGDDKTIKLWTIQGELINSFWAHNERIWRLAFAPDGQTLISASEDQTVKLWTTEGVLVNTLNQDGVIWGVDINPQGNLIASASRDDTFKLWRLDGTLVRTIIANSGGLTRVAFSPDGQNIATAGVNNQVKLWNLEGELLRTLPGHEAMVISLAFTADGNFLVSGGDDRTLIIWDLEGIKNLAPMEYACNWVGDYLRTNMEVQDSDRLLCP